MAGGLSGGILYITVRTWLSVTRSTIFEHKGATWYALHMLSVEQTGAGPRETSEEAAQRSRGVALIVEVVIQVDFLLAA